MKLHAGRMNAVEGEHLYGFCGLYFWGRETSAHDSETWYGMKQQSLERGQVSQQAGKCEFSANLGLESLIFGVTCAIADYFSFAGVERVGCFTNVANDWRTHHLAMGHVGFLLLCTTVRCSCTYYVKR